MLLNKYTNIQQHNISWCQRVLDLLDFTWAFMDLRGIYIFLEQFSIISSNERGNRWTIGETGQLAEFMEYSRFFQEIYPSQGTQAMLTQRQRKFELFFNPSQAKLEEWLEEQHRQGTAVHPYPVIT